MAQAVSTTPDLLLGEAEVLGHLLRLYEDEKQIYARVLDLSHSQGEALAKGASLTEVLGLLETKKNCLLTIRRLEMTAKDHQLAWERGRGTWSSGGRARLSAALRTIGRLIEEILACEERNDATLIEQSREF